MMDDRDRAVLPRAIVLELLHDRPAGLGCLRRALAQMWPNLSREQCVERTIQVLCEMLSRSEIRLCRAEATADGDRFQRALAAHEASEVINELSNWRDGGGAGEESAAYELDCATATFKNWAKLPTTIRLQALWLVQGIVHH